MEPLTLFQFIGGLGLLAVALASDSFWWRFTLGVVIMVCSVQMTLSGGHSPVLAPTQLLTLQTAQRGV